MQYTYRHTAVAIVIDLSKPKEIWYNLETLLNAARSRINTLIEEMKADDPGIKERLTKQAWERVGAEHTVSHYIEAFITSVTLSNLYGISCKFVLEFIFIIYALSLVKSVIDLFYFKLFLF